MARHNLVLVVVLVLVVAAACTSGDDSNGVPVEQNDSLPQGACEQAFSDAARISSLEDTVEDLNPAIRACATLNEWNVAASAYPAALDGADSTTFLRNRCVNAELAGSSLCREITGGFSQADARDRVIECLAALDPSAAVVEEIAALRRGVAGLQVDGGWFIERNDPAKFDLLGFPSWNVERTGRVSAITDEAAALAPGGFDVLCE